MKKIIKNNENGVSKELLMAQAVAEDIDKDKSGLHVKGNEQEVRAKELFATLSLTPEEEHGLLQNLFISAFALKKNAQLQGNQDNPSFAEQVIIQSNNKDVQAGLAKAEEKIGRALNASVDSDTDDDDDEVGNGKSSLPNLKYAAPKYKNVESILKYVETPNDKGVVKLVIMNFND